MIKLRNMAGAFIFNGNDLLLMKRSKDDALLPELWAPVGGHLEPDELNDPRKACLREINEEIGLTETNLDSFRLKYITLRRKEQEIRVQYLYFASTTVRNLKTTDEGALFWIPTPEIFARQFSVANEKALQHYFETGINSSEIFVGVVNVMDTIPSVSWNVLQSFESFY